MATTKEALALLLNAGEIDSILNPARSNKLFEQTQDDIEQNTIYNLLPPAMMIADTTWRYAAVEPTRYVASATDEDSSSTPIQKGGMKTAEIGTENFAEHCDMRASDMALYQKFLDSSGSTKMALGAMVVPSFANSFMELARRLQRRKTLMARDALRGAIQLPIKNSNGVTVIKSIPTGVAQIDKSVTAPWTNPATDIPSQFDEVLAATPYAPVTLALMTIPTGNILKNHPSVVDKLCCETQEMNLMSPDTRGIGAISGIQLATMGYAENEYQNDDGSMAKYIEDGEVMFVRTVDGGIFGHYNFWNFNKGCGTSCEQDLDPTFGTVMTVERKSNPAKMSFAYTASTNIDVQTPGGAIHFLAY